MVQKNIKYGIPKEILKMQKKRVLTEDVQERNMWNNREDILRKQ